MNFQTFEMDRENGYEDCLPSLRRSCPGWEWEVIASKTIALLGLHDYAAPSQVCLKKIRVSHIRGYEFREPPPQIEQRGRTIRLCHC